MLQLVLYLIAVILIGLAAFGVNPGRVSLGWLGLAIAWIAHALLPLLG